MSLPEPELTPGPARDISSTVRLPEVEAQATSGTVPAARRGRLLRVLRRHWIFGVLLVLAAALRAVVFAAYHPALIFPDSVRYLQYAQNFADGHWSVDDLRQSGYSVLIIPVMLLHDLWIIPLVQHLVGLATAVLGSAAAYR
jgi:hypothetical protein